MHRWSRVVVCAASFCVGACGASGDHSSTAPDASLEASSPLGLEAAPAALEERGPIRARLAELRGRFARTAASPTPRHAAVLAPGSTPVLGTGLVERFERVDDDRVRGVLPLAAMRGAMRSATTTLPARATGRVHLEDDTTHVAIDFALHGAADVEVAVADGLALYARALDGADVVHRVHGEGTEDFVVFEAKPAQEQLVYEVAVSHAAGLRLVSNTLEFLDAGGAPRLRMAPPWVVDARGETHDAAIAVEGCAYDTNPSGPWGRPVTKPGAATCRVRVVWGGVAYPAIVDPAWNSTGSMAVTRLGHTLTLLPSGKVLVGGGAVHLSNSTAELFDGTGSFAVTGKTSVPRTRHTATLLPGGKVLIAAGWSGGGPPGPELSTAELYDPTAGTFAPTGSLAQPRETHTATLLPSGSVLVAGGYNQPANAVLSGAELYDPAAGAFATTGFMTGPRLEHTATLLPSGNVLVLGGNDYGGGGSLSTAELFDGAGSFAATGSSSSLRRNHTATLLASGKVLIAGGNYSNLAEIFDGTGAFIPAGTMASIRGGHTATLLGSGKVVLAGGYDSTVFTTSAELFDGTSTFTATSPMPRIHYQAAAVLLASGKVLVAGGTDDGSQTVSTAELFGSSSGEACSKAGECNSSICDERCCYAACNTACHTCDAGGACVAVTGADDPSTCTGTKTCDAAGACKLKNGQASGSATTCASTFASDGVCCNAACTGACLKCGSGTCLAVKGADDADTCTGASTCDASGACKLKNGQVATVAANCASGFAADGVCCNAACGGPCDRCNLTGLVGTCSSAPVGDPGAPACTPYLCQGAATCPASCTADAQCVSGDYCTTATSGACAAKKTNGASCGGAHECTSNLCVDGVCCNSACAASCQACDVASALGTCSIVSGPPHGARSSCGGYVCQGAAATCPSSCVDDSGCIATDFCSAGACIARKPSGQACSTGAHECANGLCVDGFCCNAACTGQCEACNVGGSEGTCSPVAGAPHGSRASCGGSGLCAGKCDGAVRTSCGGFPSTSTPCAPASCSGGTATAAASCDGFGACAAATTTDCAMYTCGGTACRTSCTAASDCASGYACKAGLCVTMGGLGTLCSADSECTGGHCTAASATTSVCCTVATCGGGSYCGDKSAGSAVGTCLKTNAQACVSASECLSGSCADGLCCDTACKGQCQACDIPGNAGTCSPVVGQAPHAGRPACDSGGGNVCAAKICDGNKDTTTCQGFASGPATVCASASCNDGTLTQESVCDGAGSCKTPTTRACAPYACADTTKCGTSCAATAECAHGFFCSAGKCSAITATCSADGTQSVPEDGSAPNACGPFRCDSSSGNCFAKCATSDQCAAGASCGDALCQTAAPPTAASGGCAIEASGGPGGGRWLGLFAATLGIAGLTRRRRRAPRRSRR